MIAILTGDIINSEGQEKTVWLNALKTVLSAKGNSPKDWEIYRGDEFQLQLSNAEDALHTAFQLKSHIKSYENIDVRIAIGLGDKTLNARKITESNGSAFVNSGRKFDDLKKEKLSLAIVSGNEIFDKEMDLLLKWVLVSIDSWTAVSAEIVYLFLNNPTLSQTDVAHQLKIQQSAVSQRLKRANFDLLIQLIDFYKEKILSL
ncbi:hypothetical protein [Arachidicoccus soli]|uniref:Winged helix-turn-helix transcriptional regulator n=1 Tax=Arachidicoccus soli TaxID=2341117 RepID=A0A386HLA5_9BACT|nr:hypothetical protein [Arachidicoccus soli]AYD46678.1 hypothetical protein D6B99_03035 [Arachidicoccus soli]